VLALGGIAETVLAAHRGGLGRVLLPLGNRGQVDEGRRPLVYFPSFRNGFRRRNSTLHGRSRTVFLARRDAPATGSVATKLEVSPAA